MVDKAILVPSGHCKYISKSLSQVCVILIHTETMDVDDIVVGETPVTLIGEYTPGFGESSMA